MNCGVPVQALGPMTKPADSCVQNVQVVQAPAVALPRGRGGGFRGVQRSYDG